MLQIITKLLRIKKLIGKIKHSQLIFIILFLLENPDRIDATCQFLVTQFNSENVIIK